KGSAERDRRLERDSEEAPRTRLSLPRKELCTKKLHPTPARDFVARRPSPQGGGLLWHRPTSPRVDCCVGLSARSVTLPLVGRVDAERMRGGGVGFLCKAPARGGMKSARRARLRTTANS